MHIWRGNSHNKGEMKMFKWLKDDNFMSIIALWLLRAYIICGLIVFIICITYFGYTWIKHIKNIKRVQEFKKLIKENAPNGD